MCRVETDDDFEYHCARFPLAACNAGQTMGDHAMVSSHRCTGFTQTCLFPCAQPDICEQFMLGPLPRTNHICKVREGPGTITSAVGQSPSQLNQTPHGKLCTKYTASMLRDGMPTASSTSVGGLNGRLFRLGDCAISDDPQSTGRNTPVCFMGLLRCNSHSPCPRALRMPLPHPGCRQSYPTS